MNTNPDIHEEEFLDINAEGPGDVSQETPPMHEIPKVAKVDLAKWKKVKRPGPFDFQKKGDFVGTYMRIETAIGREAQPYERVVVRQEVTGDVFYVSGTVILDLVKNAGLRENEPLCIKFLGMAEGSNGFDYKKFELYVKERT